MAASPRPVALRAADPQSMCNRMSESVATVFIVDDDHSARSGLACLLGAEGYRTRSFGSADEFLATDPPEQPGCLVLDVRLPGLSGLDLQGALTQTERIVPIVFITGHGNVPMSVQAMKSGAVDFLQKPFEEDQLLAAIERALARCRAARAERTERMVVQRRFDMLTPRERQVLGLVVAGRLNKQIAADLGAAEKTIKIHRGRVMRKMEASSVAELVRMSQRIGIQPPAV